MVMHTTPGFCYTLHGFMQWYAVHNPIEMVGNMGNLRTPGGKGGGEAVGR